ncbi:MAG: TatD family hydrolase [bacterium]|nr:TatD family hydrolase [bacterium]
MIERAKAVGVHTFVCVGCDEESSRASVKLASEYGSLYATVGLHPTDGKYWEGKKSIAWMRELIESGDKVVGVGETGIDYFHEPFDSGLQQEMFREQCLLAQEFDLPVVVHLRMGKQSSQLAEGRGQLNEAEQDCLQILDEVGMVEGKVLFHCFSGDRQMAEEVLKRGWFLSFSGVLTYPNASELREVVKMVPIDRIVVETDCPFLAPQKYRGERNEPAYVVETAQMIAKLKEMEIGEVDTVLDANARRLFGIKML